MARIVSIFNSERVEIRLRDGRRLIVFDQEDMQPAVEVWNLEETEADVWHFDDTTDPLTNYPLG